MQAVSNVGRVQEKEDSGSSRKEKEEKEYVPKNKEFIEEDIDLYEKVNTKLKKVQKTLAKVKEEGKNLTGEEAKENMQQQVELIQQEIELQQEKLAIQEQEKDNLRGELELYGATFDSDGFLDNYVETYRRLLDEVNLIAAQFSQATSEEEEEALNVQYEIAKDAFDRFRSLYKRYDALQADDIQSTINEIASLQGDIDDLEKKISGDDEEEKRRLKAKKAIKEEIDLYERVNTKLEDADAILKDIQRDSDRLVGAEARENMNEQIGLLQRQIALHQAKLSFQQQESDLMRNQLASYGASFK